MPLEIIRNDITKMRVDAIVNAANHTLLGGGGVDGAIHRAAGPQLLEACRALNGCPTGQAKITRGYRLPARYVIHTVGPVWRGGQYGEEGLLASCYTHSLELARENGCETVAFPLISAGAYGYPKDQALSVAMRAIGDYLTRYDMLVYLVLFGREEFSQGQKLYENVQAYIDDVYVDAHFHSNVEAARKMLWQLDREKAAEYDQALNESYKALDDLMDTEVSLYISIRDPDQQKPASSHADRVGEAQPHAPTTAQPDWDAMLRQADEGFSQMLLRKIDEKGITDAQCYKKANVDRKLFSKIRSNPAYRPSKPTVFAFAVALELNLEDTKALLEKAGFALSHSSKFDIILEYFIKTRNYNVFEINEVLFHYDLALLGGSSM